MCVCLLLWELKGDFVHVAVLKWSIYISPNFPLLVVVFGSKPKRARAFVLINTISMFHLFFVGSGNPFCACE